MPFILIVILVLLPIGLFWLVYTLLWGKPNSINLAVERLGLRMLLMDPESLTSFGVLDNTLLDFHSGKLTDVSARYMQRLRQLDRDGIALIRRYDPQHLSGQKALTFQLMRWYFEQNLKGHRFDYHFVTNAVFMGPYPVNHVYGVQVDLINFLSTYPKIKGRRSARRYLQRLSKVPWKLSQLEESLQMRAVDRILPPRFVLEKSLAQVDSFLETPILANPLYTSFISRMETSGKLGERSTQAWQERVRTAIETDVLPAYRSLQTTLQSLLKQAGEEDGIWCLPDGKAYYQFLLRTHTTTDLSADEIHQIGLTEVGRITDEIRKVLVELGLPAESPGAEMRQLMADPAYHFAAGDPGREAICTQYQAILDEVNARMPEVFSQGALDKIIVKRLPEFREPDSPIAYAEAPSMDGSRPGTMWLNLREPENVYQWGMRTLAYHEGIPGHVYQMAQAQKIKGIPTFRKAFFFNAYVEGWALYAERLGWELGLEDAASNLGRLQALLWRAVRLVVDTGIHALQWTRQEAIDYMVAQTGLPERDLTTEVERYIVAPGQACAYYLGYLKFISLRKKAESTLGESFDLKAFHDVVINNGGLPLSLLEQVVNAYIDQVAGF